MPFKVRNLIVFGDSMSDIGNKRVSGMGRVARGLGLMRTNDIGRFSDRKSWTDFVWEWAGGRTMIRDDAAASNKLTAYHRQLVSSDGRTAAYDSPAADPFLFVNYAEGGAMGASDRSATGLGTFADQKARYLSELGSTRASESKLYVVWFGLNDLVTNKRDKNEMLAVVQEQLTICRDLQRDKFGHILLMNVPNPQGAVRYAGLEHTADLAALQHGAFEYGHHMKACIDRNLRHFQPNTVHYLDVYSFFEEVNENLAAYGLRAGAQPRGVKVRYPSTDLYQGGIVTRFATKNRQDQVTMVDGSPLAYELETQCLTPYDAASASRRGSRTLQLEMIRKEIRGGSPDEVIYSVAKAVRDQAAADTGFFGRSGLRDALDRFLNQPKYADFADPNSCWTTTSDQAHPTEAVYKLIAKYFCQKLRELEYQLGQLETCDAASFSFLPLAGPSSCPRCRKGGHAGDARYCKHCGSSLF